MPKNNEELLILCGDDPHAGYASVVVWSPIRSEEIFLKTGVRYPTFGDFTPDGETADRMDQ